MPIKTLYISFLLVGCLGTDAGSAVPSDAEVAHVSREGASQSATATDTLDLDELRACIGDDALVGLPEIHVVGQERAGDALVVRTVWVEGIRNAPFSSDAFLVVADSGCRRLDDGGSATDTEWRAARAISADPSSRDRQLAVQLAVAGGADGLREAIETYRGADWIRPRECAFDENVAAELCLGPYEAEAYRRAGIDVPQPSLFERLPSQADLSAVPYELRACVPPEARAQTGDVEYIGSRATGASLDVLYAVFRPGSASVPEDRLHSASRDLDGRCTKRMGADRETPSATRLLYEDATLERRLAEISVRRAGSPDAYARLYHETVQEGGPYACAPEAAGSDTVCVSGPTLEGLRAAGVDIQPWPR